MSDQEKAAKRAQWEEINRAKAAAKQKDQTATEKAEPRASATHKQFQAIRGTRDLLPPDTALWNRVEQTAREVFGTFGFGEIRPPIFEATELFARGVGGDTDIVSKEMYTFEDYDAAELVELRTAAVTFVGSFSNKETFVQFTTLVGMFVLAAANAFKAGQIPKTPENERTLQKARDLITILNTYQNQGDRELLPRVGELKDTIRQVRFGDVISLRPEATASVCRAYIEHNMQQLTQPVRLYYIGPMFRRERPQKGRYRQFYQIGAEVLEAVRPDPTRDTSKEMAKDAAVDAELIEMLTSFFDRCGLQGATLNINSIGHNAPDCRRAYIEKLRTALTKVKEKLGSESQRRIETNPLRVLDSKLEHEQPIIATLPHIVDSLCDDCKANYAELKRQLDLRGVKYHENWRLVRGLDYYVRTTFEITARGLGSQDAVCGGGRYDGLVELLGGPPTKGVGFAIGEDRLILSLLETMSEAGETIDEGLPGFSTVMQRPDVAVAGTSIETWDKAVQLAASLRKRGLSVFLPKSGTKLQRVFDSASKLGIRVAIVVGEDELKRDDYVIRVLSPLDPNGQRDFPVKTDDVLLFGKLVKLRQDLERSLLRLATGSPVPGANRSLLGLAERLTKERLLPIKTAEELRNVVPTLNLAIHGAHPSGDSVQRALAFGNLLLNELEKLSPSGG